MQQPQVAAPEVPQHRPPSVVLLEPLKMFQGESGVFDAAALAKSIASDKVKKESLKTFVYNPQSEAAQRGREFAKTIQDFIRMMKEHEQANRAPMMQQQMLRT